ncbi:3032_t:CDS:2 [Scutellospora calospora]|uniref:3032_t:CDS:1 n=1 Tax=Scutellospora calospora TaxID=85575 RepID=A0ACA9KKE6_9GLOM|nr:3032_t:CDS:2 [Scutellospora calospora]
MVDMATPKFNKNCATHGSETILDRSEKETTGEFDFSRRDVTKDTQNQGTSSKKVKEPKENRKSTCKNNLKRKRDDDDLNYEELSLLFDESNEDALWNKTMLLEKNVQEYFDANSDPESLYRKSDASSFQGMIMREELKMSSTFLLFHEIFTFDNINNTW